MRALSLCAQLAAPQRVCHRAAQALRGGSLGSSGRLSSPPQPAMGQALSLLPPPLRPRGVAAAAKVGKAVDRPAEEDPDLWWACYYTCSRQQLRTRVWE